MPAAASSSRLVKASVLPAASRIARLTLDHPQTRNALSLNMLKDLRTELERIELDRNIRVVILDATGPVFSSGHDLGELASNSEKENTALMDLCSSVMQSIVYSSKPVIAKVRGTATAAGCQLVASCDLAYASSGATFATPGVRLGLFCSTPAVALSRCVGSRKHAMKMLLTGDAVSAAEAERIGLIDAAIDDGEALDREVLRVASTIASESSPHAVRVGKELFCDQSELTLESAYGLASEAMVENLKHEEAQHGIDSFLEKKRKPVVWQEPPTPPKESK